MKPRRIARRTPTNSSVITLVSLALCLHLGACSALLPRALGFDLAELESRLARRMPFKRSFGNLFDLELTRPRLSLDPAQNRMGALFDARIGTPLAGRAFTGSIKLSGTPRYEAETRSILLGAAQVESLDLAGLSPQLTQQLKGLANALAPAVFDRQPLHTFKPEDLRVAGVELVPGAIRMTPDRLLVEMGRRE